MLTLDGHIDLPWFARRHDFALNLEDDARMPVSNKYQSGFDAVFAGRIIFFSSEAAALHPLAFLVPASIVENVVEATAVEFCAGRLSFMIRGQGSVQLKEAEPIVVATDLQNIDKVAVANNLQTLKKNLLTFGRKSFVTDLLFKRGDVLPEMAMVLPFLDKPCSNLDLMLPFVGMGEGLTPSFDDFLSGMLLVDRLTGFNRLTCSDFFGAAAAKQTTIQSCQQLEFAAMGKFSSAFECFVSDFLSRPIKTGEIVKMLNYGHSSGTDILCGIWHYLNNLGQTELSEG